MKSNAPLFEAINAYYQEKYVSFHMPGHKYGIAFDNENSQDIWGIDVTELDATDNWGNPQSCIMEAQALAANAYKSKATFFLVNGSTSGIAASITCLCKRGDSIIADRSAHASFLNTCALLGINIIFANNDFDEEFSIPKGVNSQGVENLMKKHKNIKAVFLTSPNYYGICSDVENISKIVHEYGKILIVDEAHGAHFVFSEQLPVSATAFADIVISSAHKTLPAPTQSGYIHVCSDRIDTQDLHFALKFYTSSSPSYIFMCYLDLARSIMEENGKEMYNRLKIQVDDFKKAIYANTKCSILNDKNCYDQDFTRIVVNFSRYDISGYAVAKLLHDIYKIDVEMSDLFNIVCILTPFNEKGNIASLEKAIIHIVGDSNIKSVNSKRMFLAPPNHNSICKNSYNIWQSQKIYKDIDDSVGYVCAQTVSVYPPNIGVIIAGKKITKKALNYIKQMKKAGANIMEIKNNKILVIKR